MRIAWLAPDGSRVEKGEVVIRFDPTDMEKKLEDGLSARATADSRIRQKQVREDAEIRNLERDADLAAIELDHAGAFQSKDPEIFSRMQIIESEIDGVLASKKKEHATEVRDIQEGLTQVELDLLAIERRKADLQIDEAESELQKLEVQAPHEGIFVLKEMWGDLPRVGSMVWGRRPVAEIPQLDVMQAKVFVLEADAGGLAGGVPATLTLDAHPGKTFEATVKQVDALAMRRNRRVPVQYFGVLLEIAESDPQLMKPGQRVQALLILEELEDVLAVPRQAIFEKDGESVAYVLRDGVFKPVPVESGASALGRVVITSGLDAGDRVALRDPTRPLHDGGDDGSGGESGPATPGARASL
jgi:HlyD family secretion protein